MTPLLAEATRRNKELTALLAITDCALSTLEIPELLDALLLRLLSVMEADAGAILLESGGWLSASASRGLETRTVPRPPVPHAWADAEFAADRAPRFLSDVSGTAPAFQPFFRDQGVACLVVVPLVSKERVLGLLHVDWRRPRAPSEVDLHLFQIAADQCASAIANARLYEELRAASTEADRTAERLTLALDAADLGVWDWEIPAGKVFWDDTHERLFGVPSGTVAGTYENFEKFVHPDDRGRMRKAVGHALGGEPFATELRIVRPDGEIRWVSTRGHLQRAPDGSPLRLLGVTQDVTDERSRAEERELLLVRERGARRNAENAEQQIVSANRQLRALSARLAGAREEEAARIAREIHDEMGQLLTALKLEVSGMRTRLGRLDGDDAKDLQARAEDVAMLADELQGSVHRISEELRPAALDQLGLKAAVASHLFAVRQRYGIAASLEGTLGERRLPAVVETGVFRIVQELLTNVVRHAGASRVKVTLRLDGDVLTVIVADDGRGIRPEEESRSLGLLGIRERVLLLKGRFGIEGGPRGTEAVVTIPTDVNEVGRS